MQLILNKIGPKAGRFRLQIEPPPVLRSSRHRPTTVFGGAMRTRVTALSAVVVTAAGLASPATLAQTTAGAAPAADPYVVPRTSWGDPDLQGIWDHRPITPLER